MVAGFALEQVSVLQNHGKTIGWASFSVSNIQKASFDLFERAKRCVRASLVVVTVASVLLDRACAKSIANTLGQ